MASNELQITHESWLRADQLKNIYNSVKSNELYQKSNDLYENEKVLQFYEDSNCIDCKNTSTVEKNDELTEIQKFYHGKNVLITGGTGFLGKLLIEKLLRSCPGIDNLYLLVRQKRGKDIYTRIEEMFDDPIFSLIKNETPKFRHKVVVIPADCETTGLGLSITDRQTLIEKVNIVFHSAATVKFDEHLRAALATNVFAPLYLLQLAKDMKSLDVFMHVSTAYSNSHLSKIEEKFYSLEASCDELQTRIAKMTDDEINKILPRLLGPWPNTYTFTKALAEKELKQNCGNLPLGIFRPAIISSTIKEPLRAWLDNMYGATGVTVGCASGLLRTLHCDERMSADIVPADLVVNCLLAAAATTHHRHTSNPAPSEPPIYNYVSSTENRITWGDFMKYNLARIDNQPFSNAVWYICLILTRSSLLYSLYTLLLHWIPAFLVDTLLWTVGRKPKMLQVYKKIHKFSLVLSYFTTKDIVFCNKRTRQLWINISERDKKIFPFSMAEVDWDEYFDEYLVGIRRYMFKDGDETLPQARIRWKRLHYLHQTVRIIFYFVIIYILWSCFCKSW